MHRLFLAITNRMYCEYFKLFNIVVKYIKENISDKQIIDFINANNNYPVYKDLEPFKKYDFETIQNIHEILITLLNSLNGVLVNKDHDLKIYQSKNNIGLNIDNFVNTFNYNNVVMKEKIMLYISYIDFFHKLHHKYLMRFTTKLQLMYSQITHDIKFDDSDRDNKTKNKNILNNLEGDNIDNKIMKELMNSINDTNSTDNNDGEIENAFASISSISSLDCDNV